MAEMKLSTQHTTSTQKGASYQEHGQNHGIGDPPTNNYPHRLQVMLVLNTDSAVEAFASSPETDPPSCLLVQKSEIVGNFGFLESQKFDRRGVFEKGNIT